MIIYREGRLRESDTRGLDAKMATYAAAAVSFGGRFHREYKNYYTFIIYIRHRTAENNQRHLSHGFKNILFGDRGPNMHCVEGFFIIKAELRKFGEVRSHPPHPPWLRHCGTAVGELDFIQYCQCCSSSINI